MPKNRQKLFTFMWFEKDADKAAKFYASVLPDSHVDGVYPMLIDTPSGPAGSVKTVEFTLMGERFMAMTAGKHHPFNDAMSLMIEVDTQEELDRLWKGLLKGGGKEVACGWLIDRYNVRWQVCPRMLNEMMASDDKPRVKRVSAQMMKMVKLDFAPLQAAWDGAEDAERAPQKKREQARSGVSVAGYRPEARRGTVAAARRSGGPAAPR